MARLPKIAKATGRWLARRWMTLGTALRERQERSQQLTVTFGRALRQHYWKALILFGVGLGGVAVYFYLWEVGVAVRALVDRLILISADLGTPPADIRNVATGIAALLAALAAAATLVFQLVRVWVTERTTTAIEEGLITERIDRINKAVENLGAEKEVNRLGRQIIVEHPEADASIREFEWRDTPFRPPVGAEIVELGEWRNTAVTEPNLEVRIGAIYALERFDQDSDRDHIQVMEILCAYIRENSNARVPQDFPEPDWEPLPDDADADRRQAHIAAREERFGGAVVFNKAWKWARVLPPMRTDVQAALEVIGRRADRQIALERAAQVRGSTVGYRLDLRRANLQGGDLSELNFDHAIFTGARMEGANLSEARMEGADLREARMEGANLSEARMEGADLRGARMEGAVLVEARMEGAVLVEARMEGAVLVEARMEGANLRGARMEGAVLRGARMDAKTNFSAAVVRYAALKSITCVKPGLDQDQVNAMFGDGSVTLPKGLTRPAHWPEADLDWDDFEKQWRAWQRDQGYTPPAR